MGYESKIYVVKPYSHSYGSVVAMFDLCKMGYEIRRGTTFRGLFRIDKDDEYSFFADDGNTEINKDYYGDIVQRAESNMEVLFWLLEYCKTDKYWRANVFKDFLISIENTGEEYELYHFGH